MLWAAAKAEADDLSSADSLYKRAISAAENSSEPNHVAVAQCLFEYAGFLTRVGRTDEAGALQNRAEDLVHGGMPTDPSEG